MGRHPFDFPDDVNDWDADDWERHLIWEPTEHVDEMSAALEADYEWYEET